MYVWKSRTDEVRPPEPCGETGSLFFSEEISLFFTEMWIVDQSEQLAVRLLDRSNHDVIPGFSDRFVDGAAVRHEVIHRRLHVVHAEVRPRAVRHVRIQIESEFVAAHVKPDIKWLVEIRLYAEYVRPPGFKLLVKYIIHTATPIYGDHPGNEADILKSCYWESLRRAEEFNMESIAFPLLSAGIHRYPKKEAAEIAFEAIHEYFEDNPTSKIKVSFFAYTKVDLKICHEIHLSR